ncbi:hypothetical protein BDV97DRAFT_158543 [Delphinella strobiligena]|nr:hypothetical protein BDV97DRAFT_158543 [Delphinella strobiligena]
MSTLPAHMLCGSCKTRTRRMTRSRPMSTLYHLQKTLINHTITRLSSTSIARVGQSCRSRLDHVDGVDSPFPIPGASGHIPPCGEESRLETAIGGTDSPTLAGTKIMLTMLLKDVLFYSCSGKCILISERESSEWLQMRRLRPLNLCRCHRTCCNHHVVSQVVTTLMCKVTSVHYLGLWCGSAV